jgi:hypothetical protein
MATDQILFQAGPGKRSIPDSYSCDIFISAFNLSERVAKTFGKINASRKFWLIHNEYGFSDAELPTNTPLLRSSELAEADFVIEALSQIESDLTPGVRLCVDVTGFMRPHLMFLMHLLRTKQIGKFDFIYTEPSQYTRKAETVFSSEVVEVRQVNGYEGAHSVDMSTDVLVVGAGYDHDLIGHVIANKSSARLLQLLSLPSLSADMYQESLTRLHKVADAPVKVPDEQLAYASANDPFLTYIVLVESLQKITSRSRRISNLYLSPLATKPQAVGFGLYYLKHLVGKPASIIFPYATRYAKETSKGVGRTWLYELNLS